MSRPLYRRQRQALVETCRRMNALGINRGTSGNLSVRIAGGLLITPSGVPYDSLRPGKIVAMQIDGSHTGAWEPSSEWRLHRDIYRARENAGAVVHAHPGFATALACLRRGIPAFHYMIAVAGGSDIRCAPYATFGTQALSDGALQALDGRTACLLANHGMVCLGSDLAAALALAVEVEALAAQYWRACQLGAPKLLSKAQMAEVLDRFATYGTRSATNPPTRMTKAPQK